MHQVGPDANAWNIECASLRKASACCGTKTSQTRKKVMARTSTFVWSESETLGLTCQKTAVFCWKQAWLLSWFECALLHWPKEASSKNCMNCYPRQSLKASTREKIHCCCCHTDGGGGRYPTENQTRSEAVVCVHVRCTSFTARHQNSICRNESSILEMCHCLGCMQLYLCSFRF